MADRGPLGDPVALGPAADRPSAVVAGRDVTLRRPDASRDTRALYIATHSDARAEAIWAYMGYGPWPREEAMGAWIAERPESVDPFWYVVADPDDAPLGMATIMNRDAAMRRAEVGNIWYVPGAQRTTANTEAAYLMIRECFDRLGCRRVEWKCDSLNERSRVAAIRLGFTFEGVFRNHMIIKGRNRDTAWYAMTDGDWAVARSRLEHWLYDTPRIDGRPSGSLSQP